MQHRLMQFQGAAMCDGFTVYSLFAATVTFYSLLDITLSTFYCQVIAPVIFQCVLAIVLTICYSILTAQITGFSLLIRALTKTI